MVENVDGAVVGFQDRAEELISRLYNNFEATPKVLRVGTNAEKLWNSTIDNCSINFDKM